MRLFLPKFKNLLSVTLPTLVVLLIILEVFFTFIIPASDPPRGFFYEEDKMSGYVRDNEGGYNTIGRFSEIKAKWRINNMGWNSPIDYYPIKKKKLISIIGDSYIEAFQVDIDKSYPSLLRKKLLPKYDIYTFGKGGFPLSQYLHVSRYVNEHFNPDILVFNMIHNDFDESIHELSPKTPSFLQLSYNEEEDSFTEKVPIPDFSTGQYRPKWQSIVYKSSLFRYLYHNLKFSNTMLNIINHQINGNPFEGNVDYVKLKKQQNLVMKATEHLIGTIKRENKDTRIIFIMDAPRISIYSDSLGRSNILWMNDMMKEICHEHDIEFIDLTEPMKQDYVKNGEKFNSELDFHWNEYGHEFTAEVLFEYLQNNKQ